jgi:hypothetical protein
MGIADAIAEKFLKFIFKLIIIGTVSGVIGFALGKWVF